MSCTTYLRAVLTAPSTLLVRRISLLAVAAFVFAQTLTPVSAQQTAATGTIRGKVLNATNGAYLKNATIGVSGTNLETFTDDYGEYELSNVPAGEVSLKADYIGEPQQSISVTVTAGTITSRDFTFRQTASTQLDKNGTVVLDPLVVSTERYRNAAAISIAEERHSVNIKNVVSVDQFGNIPSNNVGDFVKFLPGVQVSYGSFGGNNQGYSDSEPSGISVRGFGPEDTAILIDGLPVSNATPGSLTRQVALDQLSINNASRVEIIKVTTPDMPSNSPGGQVNLITKSAFEFAKPGYSGRVYFNFNSLHTSLGKTPGPTNKSTYKTKPGFDFTVTYPVSNKLGFSFTGSITDQFDQTYRAQPILTTSGSVTNAAGQVVSLSNPIISRYQITDTPRISTRKSGNIRADWKPTPSQTIRANVEYSTYDSVEGQRRLDARPTIAAGADWGPNYTIGTTANSTLDMTVTTRDKIGKTKSGQIQYDYKLGGWNLSAAGSLSVSTSDYVDRENGHFSEVGLKMNPGQVRLVDINDSVPGAIATYARVANGGAPSSYTKLSNYGFDGTIAKSGEAFSKSTVGLLKLDVSRSLDFLRFLGTNSLSVQGGFRRDWEKTEKSGLGTGYQEELQPGKSYAVLDILDNAYVGQTPGFNLPGQEWGSTYKLFELNKTNSLFYVPPGGSTASNNYASYANQQKNLKETTDGWYGMLTGRFFKNRLTVLGGMRQETKARNGFGPFTDTKWNYAKNGDGQLYKDAFYLTGVKLDGTTMIRTNADGTTTSVTSFLSDSALLSRMTAAGIKFPDHLYNPTTSASLESRMLQLQALRRIDTKVRPDPNWSLSTAFELTKKIQLKAGWSRANKLPPLENGTQGILSGNGAFSINENVPIPADGTKGNISVANPNIKPELSTGYDAEISYYTNSGGKLSVSYWTKKVTNGIINFSTPSDSPVFLAALPALGLDPADFQDWRLATSSNATTKQNTDGWEFEVRQDFGFLGRWGKPFAAFVTYSFKSLADPAPVEPVTFTSPNGTPVTITPTVRTISLTANRFGGAGLQYSGKRLTLQVRGTYRNDNELAANRVALANGNFLRRFEPAETRIDFNVGYTINKHFSAFVSGRDVFNAERKIVLRDDLGLLPEYARTFEIKNFGVTWTAGLNATF